MKRIITLLSLIPMVFGASVSDAIPINIPANNGKSAAPNSSNGCTPKATPKDDVIDCVGIDIKGVAGGNGNDMVTIEQDAVVSTLALDPHPQAITIDGGDGNDYLLNLGTVIAEMESLGNGLKAIPALGSDPNAKAGATANDQKAALAVGMQGGDGNDTIENQGSVTANANTTVGNLTGKPAASDALARAIGISGGAGDDAINNSGDVLATAVAIVLKSDEAPLTDISASNDSSTVDATSIGIDGGSENDAIFNSGKVMAISNATVGNANLSGSSSSTLSSPDSANSVQSNATGISAGAGDDYLNNSGEVNAIATADSASLAITVPANGAAAADSTSTATSKAVGIDMGDGQNSVQNTGNITANATSVSAALGAQVSDSGGSPLPKSTWKGGATAESDATGISTGAGDDSIHNSGSINAVATSVTHTAVVSIAASDVATASSSSTSSAKTTGVDAGTGDDTITNSGDITAVSTATADAIGFALSENGNAKAAHDGGASADAQAIGISADGSDGEDGSSFDPKILPHSLTLSYSKDSTAPIGNDTVTNTGTVSAVATALSGSGNAAISTSGAASSSMKSTADAAATGVDLGAGDDTLNNSGSISAVATATSGALGITFSEQGDSKVEGGPESTAKAVGLSGDGVQGNTLINGSLSIGLDGLKASLSRETTAGSGADVIDNSGAITAVATALSGSEGGAVSISGASSANVDSKANSSAMGVDAGAGNDKVTNTGSISAVATSTAYTSGIGFSQNKKAEVEAGASADAQATGINGDGLTGTGVDAANLSIGLDGLTFNYHRERNAATGADTIDNSGAVSSVATAISGAQSAAVSISGAASAGAKAESNASATGIDLGAGNDVLKNSGAVTSVATAVADSFSLSFSQGSEGGQGTGTGTGQQAESSEAKVTSGSSATAQSTGVSADGSQGNSSFDTSLQIGLSGLDASFQRLVTAGSGNDSVTNTKAITSVATALSGAQGGAASISNAASADVTSSASASATGIDLGAGDDVLVNTPDTSVADTSGYTAPEIAPYALSGLALFTMPATQSGLMPGSVALPGEKNYSAPETQANPLPETTLPTGLDNSILPQVLMYALPNADAYTLPGSQQQPVASTDGQALPADQQYAAPTTDAISPPQSSDVSPTGGSITAVASSAALATSVSFSDQKTSSVKGGAEASSNAVGVSADGAQGNTALQGSFSVGPDGLSTSLSYEKTAGSGADSILNNGAITAVADATSGSDGAAISVSGASSADMTSKATSSAMGVDAGGGSDLVNNTGAITAVATATSGTVGISFSEKDGADVKVGSEAEVEATGISGDGAERESRTAAALAVNSEGLQASFEHSRASASGDDTINNSGAVTAVGIATSATSAAAVSVEKNASTVADSSAKSLVTGIDAGGGNDAVTNSGAINALSVATAAAISAAVSEKGSAGADPKTVWQGSIDANAEAVGISGDGTDKDVTNQENLNIGFTNPSVDISTQTTYGQVGGSDTIINSGELSATAIATTPSADVAVSLEDTAVAMSSSNAGAKATAIDSGAGDDLIKNQGALVSTAIATATQANVAVTKKTAVAADSLWNGGTSAESTAVGISGDGEGDVFSVTGNIHADAQGVSADGRIASDVVSGNDDITNDGAMVVTAGSVVPDLNVAVSVEDVGAAISSSSAQSSAVGIDAGAGDDKITNHGALVVTAGAAAAAANVAVTKDAAVAGNSVWDGGTKAQADAVGISGDGQGTDSVKEGSASVSLDHVALNSRLAESTVTGNDDIKNDSAVVVTSAAVVPAISVAVASKGMSAAVSTATAAAHAAGIDAGAGDDKVDNSGSVTTQAIANADTVNVAVSLKDAALAADAVWEGGSTATANAVGISGDGEGSDQELVTNIDVSSQGVNLTRKSSETTVTGADDITNSGTVTTTALSLVPSIGVAVTASSGLSAALTGAEATSKAAGIDAGAGDDHVTNDGVLTSTAGAVAASLSVAVTAEEGVAASGNSVWDGGTKADAESVGISGDGEGSDHIASTTVNANSDGVHIAHAITNTQVIGNDIINNSNVITSTSVAVAGSGSGSVVPAAGLAASVTTSTAHAKASGIDAGGGDDTVTNSSVITSSAVAIAGAASVAYASEGGAVAADAIWSGGTTADSEAIGIGADGVGRDHKIFGDIVANSDGTNISALISDTTEAGNDTIANSGVVTSTALVLAPSVSVSVTPSGLAASSSTATTSTRAVAIDAGAGNDAVDNTGVLTSTAGSVAVAVPIAVAPEGAAVATDAIWDGGTKADSEAVGISGDGKGTDGQSSFTIQAKDGEKHIDALTQATTVSGDDTIINDATITATAVSEVISAAVSVTPAGAAVAGSASTATAHSAAIDAGAGNDVIDTDGALTSTALANGNALSVSVAPEGVAVAGGPIFSGGTEAIADAVGISGDGQGADTSAETKMDVDSSGAHLRTMTALNTVSGDDQITNKGTVTTTSVAIAPSVGVSVTATGVAATASTATADAHAAGIDGGGGNDSIDNSGTLTVTAGANADAVSVAVAGAGVAGATDSVWSGGTKANAEAIGIAGDGEGRDNGASFGMDANKDAVSLQAEAHSTVVKGNDDIKNSGVITATAGSLVPSVNVAVTPAGLSVASSTATTTTRAAAIDAGSGSDKVDNTGTLTATAASVSVAVPVAVAPTGVAVATDAIWDGGTKADSEAVGISGDGKGTDYQSTFSMEAKDGEKHVDALTQATTVSGDDTIKNDATVTASAVSEVISAAVSVTPAGAAVAGSAATATAHSAAIDAGAGNDVIDTDGALTSTAVANGNAVSVSVAPAGVAVAGGPIFSGGTKAIADAVGISGDGQGTDARAEMSMNVDATGSHLHTMAALNIVSGDDQIKNKGTVTTTAVAVAPSVGVSITAGGVAAAASTATADAHAAGIDGGAGNDGIDNSGTLTVTAGANADAVSVAVAGAGVAGATDSVWSGGTKANAEAIGIAGDGEGRDNGASFGMDANNDAVSLQAEAHSTVVKGDDDIKNTGVITATAGSLVPSVNVAVTPAGLSIASSTATTTTRAAAIDAGSGNDKVDNSGTLTSSAASVSVAVPVAVAPAGVAVATDAIWDGGTKADSEAVGISGDGKGTDYQSSLSMEASNGEKHVDALTQATTVSGDDTIMNDATVTATAVSEVISAAVSVTPAGVAVAGSAATATAHSAAIDAGAGNDVVDSDGTLTSTAVANGNAISVSVAPGGLAVAGGAIFSGGTQAKADSVGISGDGKGTDATAESTMNVDDTGAHLRTKAELNTVSGDDQISNKGKITSTAVAVAPSVDVSVTAGGVAAAVSTGTANATSTAIDAGAGNDDIDNSGDLHAISVANADAVSVSVAGVGVAVAGDSVWSGGSKANAVAIGIAGDGKGTEYGAEFSMDANHDGVEMASSVHATTVSGNDHIHNTGAITAEAASVVPSIGVAVTPTGGVSVASTTAQTQARSAAIDAGAGDDTVDNSGELNANAQSISVSIPVSVAVAGGAVATDAIWDGGTKSDAEAVGISGDGAGSDVGAELSMSSHDGNVKVHSLETESMVSGNDRFTNSGAVNAHAVGVSTSAAVAVTPFGVSAAAATASAKARAAALDAGAGDDVVDNTGHLQSTSTATGVAVSAAVSIGSSVAADAIWNGGTKGNAESVGIAGDGRGVNHSVESNFETGGGKAKITTITSDQVVSGNDQITNKGKIDATATAVTPSVAASVTAGVSVAAANSTADAYAGAIDAGAGDDTIINDGQLSATSNANADSVGFAFGGVSVAANGIFDGGTTSNAEAVGIYGDGRGGNDVSKLQIENDGLTSKVSHSDTKSSATGADHITNTALINAEATATSPAVSVSIGGMSAAVTTSSANARAAAIDAGGSGDIVENSGDLIANAKSTAVTTNVAVSGSGALALDAVWDGGTTAKAEAVGISGDGNGTQSGVQRDIQAQDGVISFTQHEEKQSQSGNDTIGNSATIQATATATAPSISVAFSGTGGSVSLATATANARAAAIEGGAGNDGITNSDNGELTAMSNAEAHAVNVALTTVGISGAADAVWDGGTTATSDAVGINGDGGAGGTASDTMIQVDSTGVTRSDSNENTNNDGNDTISNAAAITAQSDALSTSTSVGITVAGISAALSTSTADSSADAIRAGGGDDQVDNSGDLKSQATANANSVGVTVTGVGASVSADAFWDGGTHAKAHAGGIDGGDGADTVKNTANITSTGIANAKSTQVGVAVAGVAAALSASTADAGANAINGGAGDDTIDNSGALQAVSTANSKATSVSVGLLGLTAADASAHANAKAVGIDAGDGNDTVTNSGAIISASSAEATGNDVSVTGVGADLSVLFSGQTQAVSEAQGIASGAGNDDLENDAAVALNASADVATTSVSLALAGFTSADASALASANVVGMVGGAGDDQIKNRGQLNGVSNASTLSRALSGNFIGLASADLNTTTAVDAMGMDGGDGNDSVFNYGLIGLDTSATANTEALTISLAGLSDANVLAQAIAGVTGMSGGEGNDDVINGNNIALTASSTANAAQFGANLAGVGNQQAGAHAEASTVGLAGGGGDDSIGNAGNVTMQSTADANVVNASWNLVGLSSDQALVDATAQATGISGGAGKDVLLNDVTGAIDLGVDSTLKAASISSVAIGGASANTTLSASLNGTGMSGDEGDDAIYNDGSLNVHSDLVAQSNGFSLNLAGVSKAKAGMDGNTTLYGMTGGTGDDMIANSGTAKVSASSTMTISNSSWTFAGVTGDSGTLNADTNAIGASGGEGADWLHNEGSFAINAASYLTANGGSDSIFGKADSGASLEAKAAATGMDGGNGDDVVESFSDITVHALSSVASSGASFTLAGAASSSVNLLAESNAWGLVGGAGSDGLYNAGALTVEAKAENTANGGASTAVFGEAGTTLVADAKANAVGIDAGEGDDHVTNAGSVAVTALAEPGATSDVSVGGLLVNGESHADTSSSMGSTGVGLGSGTNTLGNSGSVSAAVDGRWLSKAVSKSSLLTVIPDAKAFATTVVSDAHVSGVTAEDGVNTINNEGGIEAKTQFKANSTASSDGSSLTGGNSRANAQSKAKSVTAYGINLGDGDNVIANSGSLSVTAQHSVHATSGSNANGINFFNSVHSNSAAVAQSDDTLAVGVRTGDGNNNIWNDGDINVTSAPKAYSTSNALSTYAGFSIDSASQAYASVNGAQAIGIEVGNGANAIYNTGSIVATSSPYADAHAFSEGRGWGGDATSKTDAEATDASAYGIKAGDGGNLVVNDGSIDALSQPSVSTYTVAQPGSDTATSEVDQTVCKWQSSWSIFQWVLNKVCTTVKKAANTVLGGNKVETPKVDLSGAQAYGIWSGAGDDVIANNGNISAKINKNGVITPGVAIHSGAGNDQVFLNDGSSLYGDVDLGTGDDTLSIVGTPALMQGNFYGGGGTDTLGVDGSGQLYGSASGFEALKLYGTSQFTLNSLATVQSLGVNNGTLTVHSNYAMTPDGSLDVQINGDGSHGQLASTGTVTLNGALNVNKSTSAYVDGTKWDVVSANSVGGSFISQSLPDSTLVSFSTEKTSNQFNVIAHVDSFTSMAEGSTPLAVAGYLDSLLASSTGELSVMLGKMQNLPATSFNETFNSLNPSRYDTFKSTDFAMHKHILATQDRMMQKRDSFMSASGPSFMTSASPFYVNSLSFDSHFVAQDSSIKDRTQGLSGWIVGFNDSENIGGSNSSAQSATYANSMGLDYAYKSKLLLGVSYGSSSGSAAMAGGKGNGEMGSMTTSVYASYLLSAATYLDTMISFSNSHYIDSHNVIVGKDRRIAAGEHNNQSVSFFGETGREIEAGGLRSQIFGSMSYSAYKELGLEEVGAGSLNLVIDPREYNLLTSKFGMRSAFDMRLDRGTLTPQFEAALVHYNDFGDNSMTVHFTGTDVGFSIPSQTSGDNGALLGMGMNYESDNGWSLRWGINGDIGTSREGEAAYLQLNNSF